jgi:SAM-dependent methyltransferase
MPSPIEPLFVGMLPRVPFLVHSEQLLQHLLSYGPAHCHTALEIGCGPRSPLLPMLRRHWPEIEVHQIDARPDVVAAAKQHHPGGRVEQMLASDMAAIPDGSKQLVVAMSVFDQNAEDLLPAIAREIHRVLVDDGIVVYIHNEEMNLPSAAASLLQRSSGHTLLLPSDSWQPENDFEYCSADRAEVEQALAKLGAEALPLAQYLSDLYPALYGTPPNRSEYSKIAAPVMRDYTLGVMSEIRRWVARLRQQHGVRLDDHRTRQLLQRHIEGGVFCKRHGFQIERSGFFELRQSSSWQGHFQFRPPAAHFVRGTVRFGYATTATPPPTDEFAQDLNRNPTIKADEVMFIAYQYGLVARKI